MDEAQLADRVRDALREHVDGVFPAHDLKVQLHRRLAAGRGRAATRPRWSWSALACVAGGTAVALGVALVAVVALHRGSSNGTPAARPVPAGARELVARLAVLRRPQLAADLGADRLASSVRGGPGTNRQLAAEGVVASLTRLAAVVTLPRSGANSFTPDQVPGPHTPQDRLYVIVTRPHSRLQPGAGVDQVGVVCVSSEGGSGGGSGETAAELERGEAEFSSGHGVQETIVPDGVSRVKWVFSGLAPYVTHRIVIYPTVRNNLAYSLIRTNEGGLVSATWYDSHGRVIPPTR